MVCIVSLSFDEGVFLLPIELPHTVAHCRSCPGILSERDYS